MTGHFMRGDAITGVSNKPDGDKPFAHSNRAVLKDSAEFDGELLLAGKTLPCTAGRDKGDFRRLADGTGHVAIRPTHQDGEVMGIIQVGEVFNGFYRVFGRLLCSLILPLGVVEFWSVYLQYLTKRTDGKEEQNEKKIHRITDGICGGNSPI